MDVGGVVRFLILFGMRLSDGVRKFSGGMSLCDCRSRRNGNLTRSGLRK